MELGTSPQFKIDGHRGLLTASPTPRLIAATSALEGRKAWKKHYGLIFEVSQHNLDILANAAQIPAPEISSRDDDSDLATRFKFKTVPYDHQITMLDEAAGKRDFAFFCEQGTGKTKVAIDLASQKYTDGQITGVILVAPNGVHNQWADTALSRHSPVAHTSFVWPKIAGIKDRKRMKGPKVALEWFLLNIEALRTKRLGEVLMEFVHRHEGGKLMMIIDESHKIKNVRSQAWKAAKRYGAMSSYRIAMTGTPIGTSLEDEWAQLNWLNEDIIGVKYLTTFRREYCIMGGYQNRSVIGHINMERFKKKAAPYISRVKKDELGLLPKSYVQKRFDLAPAQKAMFSSMKRDLVSQIYDGTIATAQGALDKIIRLQQITSGFVNNEDGNLKTIIPASQNPRLAALREIIESNDDKHVIWCNFHYDVQLLADEFKDVGAVTYYGPDSVLSRQEAKDKFIMGKGAPRLFISTPGSGGTGLDGLQESGCVSAIYYSHGYNYINRIQSEDRLHRIGTKGIVTCTDLISQPGIDLRIRSTDHKKEGIMSMALDNLKDFADGL